MLEYFRVKRCGHKRTSWRSGLSPRPPATTGAGKLPPSPSLVTPHSRARGPSSHTTHSTHNAYDTTCKYQRRHMRPMRADGRAWPMARTRRRATAPTSDATLPRRPPTPRRCTGSTNRVLDCVADVASTTPSGRRLATNVAHVRFHAECIPARTCAHLRGREGGTGETQRTIRGHRHMMSVTAGELERGGRVAERRRAAAILADGDVLRELPHHLER